MVTTDTFESVFDAYHRYHNRLYYIMDEEQFPWLNKYTCAWAVDKNKISWDSDNGESLQLDSNKIVWQPRNEPLFGRMSLDWQKNIQVGQDAPHLFRLKINGHRLFQAGYGYTHLRLDSALITPWSKNSNNYGRGQLNPIIWLRRAEQQAGRGVTLEFHPDDYDPNR